HVVGRDPAIERQPHRVERPREVAAERYGAAGFHCTISGAGNAGTALPSLACNTSATARRASGYGARARTRALRNSRYSGVSQMLTTVFVECWLSSPRYRPTSSRF